MLDFKTTSALNGSMTAVAQHPGRTSGSPESPVPPSGVSRRTVVLGAVVEAVVVAGASVAGATFFGSDRGPDPETAAAQAAERIRILEALDAERAKAKSEMDRIEAALRAKPLDTSRQAQVFRRVDGQVVRGIVEVLGNPNLAYRNPIYLGAGNHYASVMYTMTQGDGLPMPFLVPFESTGSVPQASQATIDNTGTGGPIVTAFVEGGILPVGQPIYKE